MLAQPRDEAHGTSGELAFGSDINRTGKLSRGKRKGRPSGRPFLEFGGLSRD
jgi:hypothetical protein